MPAKKQKNQLPDMISAFEELKALGDNILLPLSVDSDVLTEKQGRAQNDVTVSYLHRFDFGDFFISLVYTPKRSSLTATPSVLEARICLDKTEPLFFLSPYDTIPYINANDLICRYFPYIESPERLKSCYKDLAESLVPYLSDFARIAADPKELTKAYDNLRGEMVRCYGDNIFHASGKGEEYDSTMLALRFYHFVKWKSSYFSSNEYHQFLIGNYSALTMLVGRKFVPDYFRHLSLAAPTLQQAPIKAVRQESASLPAMMEASKRAITLPLLLLSALVSIPVMAILLGILYFTVAAIVGSGAEFYTAFTLTSFLHTGNLILLSALAISFSTSFVLLRLFFKKRYEAYRPYRIMAKQNPIRTFPTKLKKIVLFIAVIFVTLSACRGVSFTDQKIVKPEGYLPFQNVHLDYQDVEAVIEYTRKDGSFYYEFSFRNSTEGFSLASVMSPLECETIRDTLLPILERNGITVVKKEDVKKPSPDSTPESTPDSTPESTPDSTPESTPDTAPEEVPGKDSVTVSLSPLR